MESSEKIFYIAACDDDACITGQIQATVEQFMDKTNEDRLGFSLAYNYWNDAASCIQALKEGFSPDVLFLDIEMGEISGLDVGRVLREEQCNYLCQIIFISSHSSYSMELHKLQIANFLIKPLKSEDIVEEIHRCIQRRPQYRQEFVWQNQGYSRSMPVEEIYYFSGQEKKITIHGIYGEYKFWGNLSALEKEGVLRDFIRVHQSFLVNPFRIQAFNTQEIQMANGDKISVSRRGKAVLMEHLGKNRRSKKGKKGEE